MSKMETQDPYSILEYPLSTEKAVREMEAENKLVFMVALNSNKKQIRWAVQKAFNAKVLAVRTEITPEGKKKAIIKLSPTTPASEITTQLGLV